MNRTRIARSINRHARWRSGNAIIEMSFVFPILLWLSMGMVEFGQFFYIRAAFVAAARDGCRNASLSTATQTSVINAMNATLKYPINSTPAIDLAGTQSTWVKFYDVNTAGTTATPVTDITTIPTGDGVEIAFNVTYDTIPNVFRPLYTITGKGIGTGKIISVKTTMAKN